jgi:hypothetical protein
LLTCMHSEVVKEVAGLAPYERRVIELLRNSKDKRARKLAKKRVSLRSQKSTPLAFYSSNTPPPARHLRPRQGKGRRAPARHCRVPPDRPLNNQPPTKKMFPRIRVLGLQQWDNGRAAQKDMGGMTTCT